MKINRQTAARVAVLMERLARGDTTEAALDKAGLPADEAADVLKDVAKDLSAAAASSQPQRTTSKSSGKSARSGDGGLALVVHADGASRGNPGAAACAAIVLDSDGDELLRRTRTLGKTTNNVAEYEGVILGLESAKELRASRVTLKLDSELAVKQLNGQYKVRNENLKPLFERARILISQFDAVRVVHVPRKENAAADKLANEALDGKA